ncbi:hypothetical protein OHC33_000148 [Knufia fluminis]|uniref:Uncharacterized protein n=1 Tax=Knufia fluminis TaxID=191047 RepID=A0AAN8F1J9_9EURO|nr:hypothetical protein OHC33_000148 [Knufia fluminis]
MASEPRNILAMGLTLPHSSTIISDQKDKAKTRNFILDMYEFDISASHDEVIVGLTQYLKSKKYVAISIGFGVRGNRDLTPLFEKLVNACIEHQPGAKFGFALLPTAVVEACERVLQ